jgi:hypothetical protein
MELESATTAQRTESAASTDFAESVSQENY